MNFKLKKWKVIVSVAVAIISWVIFIVYLMNSRSLINADKVPGFIIQFINTINLGNLLNAENIFLFIIEVIMIYILISLFDRKKK